MFTFIFITNINAPLRLGLFGSDPGGTFKKHFNRDSSNFQTITALKQSFSLMISSKIWPDPQETAVLFTFTE